MHHGYRPRVIPITVLVCSLAIAGCRQTIYQPLDAADSSIPDLDRRVSYRLDPDYVRHAPSCAAILVQASKASRHIVTAIEGAVERHLATRLIRILGASDTRLTAGRLGIDFTASEGRKRFAELTGCDAVMSVRLLAVTDRFWGIWANREVGLELRLVRLDAAQREIWVARHTAARSDGGVPLSLISLPFSVGRATLLTRDDEAFHSIADDAVRRMMATLPDVRGAFPEETRFRPRNRQR